MKWREFRRKNGKATLYWKICQSNDSYTTEHGQMGTDKPQTFSDTPGAKGKEETKAYVDAVDNCSFHIEREIRKKSERGYVEYIDGKPVAEEVTELDFSKMLPKNFCGYKPQTSIKEAALKKAHAAGKARYTRKYDGMCHFACKHIGGWEIYTRRMDLATDRFPNHIDELNQMDVEVGTILEGEMVCSTDGLDDFTAISRICRSDSDKARKLIADGECPEPNFRIFDMLYYNGKSLEDKTYDQRRDLITSLCDFDLTNVVPLINTSPDDWEQLAKDNNWEGFVFVDGRSKPGDKFFSFNGEPKRPKGHHKLKPVYEEDVVIYGAVKGSGKRLGTVGSVLIKQRHPDTGDWFRCGKVGSGFTEQNIIEVHKLLDESNLPIFDKEKDDKEELSDNGIVAMIECSERMPGTNKFRFPVFIRVHGDKTPTECTSQRFNRE